MKAKSDLQQEGLIKEREKKEEEEEKEKSVKNERGDKSKCKKVPNMNEYNLCLKWKHFYNCIIV